MATTRWHGTCGANGLRRSALPTARGDDPRCADNKAYVDIEPRGIWQRRFHYSGGVSYYDSLVKVVSGSSEVELLVVLQGETSSCLGLELGAARLVNRLTRVPNHGLGIYSV